MIKRDEKIPQVLTNLAYALLVVGILLAGILMAILMFIGFYEMYKGVSIFFNLSHMPEHTASKESSILAFTLKGLEFLFLAPLGFLTLLSMAKYIANMQSPDHTEADRGILEVKALIVSLMIAIIATDLIARVLSGRGLTYEVTLTGSLFIAVLGAYFVSLHKLANLSGHRRRDETPN